MKLGGTLTVGAKMNGLTEHGAGVIIGITSKGIDVRDARIAELEDILDMRNAAIEALCIAVHGSPNPELSIYHLIVDVAAMKARVAEFIAAQEPLGPEFEAIWDANVEALYDN
jgi:hypothetical protein